MHKTLTFLVFFLFSSFMYAQDGTLDATFGTNGLVTTAVSLKNDRPSSIIVQTDGKIIVAGTSYNGFTPNFMQLVRYNTNGTLDNTFGTNGIVNTQFGTSTSGINGIALQTDGKIVAVGYVSQNMRGEDFAIVRYRHNGLLDSTFNGNGTLRLGFNVGAPYTSSAAAVAIQTDGKIVVGGTMAAGQVFNNLTLVRLNSNGALDTSFNKTGIRITDVNEDKADAVVGLTLRENNKILVFSHSSGPIAPKSRALVQYNTNGSLDTLFGDRGIVTISADCDVHKVLRNGKILVGGISSDRSLSGYSFTLFRYNINGSLDASFGTNGQRITLLSLFSSQITDIVEEKSGKFIVGGRISSPTSSSPDWCMIRYQQDGDIDNTFGTLGTSITPTSLADNKQSKMTLQSDGKILVCGSHFVLESLKYNFNVSRFNNTTVSVKNAAKNTPLSIFPNPTTNALNIDFKEPINEAVKLTITDVSGKIFYQQNYDKGLINNSLQINIADFSAGLYIVNIVSDKENISRIIAKQ